MGFSEQNEQSYMPSVLLRMDEKKALSILSKFITNFPVGEIQKSIQAPVIKIFISERKMM